MKEYYLHTDKKDELKFKDIYEVENKKASRLYLEEKTFDFKIVHSLKKYRRRDAIEILDGEDLLTAIYERDEISKDYKSLKKYDKIVKLLNSPGEYYPRIFRPIINKEKSFLSQEKLEKTIKIISGKYDFLFQEMKKL